MHFIIYSHPSHRSAQHLHACLTGHMASLRAPMQWRGDVIKCDAAIVFGWHEKQRAIAAAYKARGIPTLVVDWGYIARVNNEDERETGYWQISPGGLNQPPRFACPDTRFRKTGCELAEKRGGNRKGYTLVCGQVPNDAAVAGTNHAAWLVEQLGGYPDAVYREHPRGGVKLPDYLQCNGLLSEALAGARLVVCYNSNVAHEALLAGVPVVCDPSAPYAKLSGEKLPSLARRRDYFNRIAFGQWRWDQLGAGVEFTMNNLSRWFG